MPLRSRRAVCAVAALTVAGLVGAAPGAHAAPDRLAAREPAAVATGNRYRIDFQANNGLLYRTGPSGPANLLQGMAPGTSPATTELSGGGHQTAFQANTGELIVFGDRQTLDTRQGMLAGTSPSIAAADDGSFQVAFQANNGRLYTYDSVSGPADTGQAMAPRTSPDTAYFSYGTYFRTVFQSPFGELMVKIQPFTYGTRQLMAPGTSPSIDFYDLPPGYWGLRVCFQADTGNLVTLTEKLDATGGSLVVADTGQGMMTGTSPAVAALSDGSYQTAFQANTGELVYQGAAGINTRQGMLAGTSPSIVATAGGGWLSGFQANTGYLYTYSSTTGPANTLQGMLAGTSPGIG